MSISELVRQPKTLPCLIAALLVAAALADTARAQLPPQPMEVIFAHRVEFTDPTLDVDTLRASFEVRQINATAEGYTLKVYDAGLMTPPENVVLLAEKDVTVDGTNPLQPEQIWIDEPPLPMKRESVSLGGLVTASSGAVLFAVEMTMDQLQGAGVVAFLEDHLDEPDSFYSIDDGNTWTLLTVGRLECLLGGDCTNPDDSIYVRVNVSSG